jgi:hypothetical protein
MAYGAVDLHIGTEDSGIESGMAPFLFPWVVKRDTIFFA